MMKICSASHRSRRERVQYCRFGRIRCRRPAAAGSAGHADRPSGKTSGLHCRHGGVLRRPSSWSAVHNTGAQRPFDVTEVCAATIPVVGKGACKHCARSDATAITRTADRLVTLIWSSARSLFWKALPHNPSALIQPPTPGCQVSTSAAALRTASDGRRGQGVRADCSGASHSRSRTARRERH